MNLRQRLRRAEYAAKRLGHLTCRVCRQRRGLTLVVGTTPSGAWEERPPEPCSACGAVPEQIIVLSETIVVAGDSQSDEPFA
jgi:hypothetical protein